MMSQPSERSKTLRARQMLAAFLLSASAMFLLFTGAAGATVAFNSSFGGEGAGAGKFSEPAGMSINNSTGDLYVADRHQHRIQEFTGAGSFVRAWGYDVVESGVDNKPFADEVQKVTIKATGGSFRLGYEGQFTGGVSTGDVASGSAMVSNLPVVSGKADTYENSIYVYSYTGGPWTVGLPITGPGIESGTTITEVGSFYLGLSKPATATASQVGISVVGAYPFAVGQTISGPGIPAGTTIQAIGSGTLTLSANATASMTGAVLSSGIPYDISATGLEEILNGVPALSEGSGAVNVSGGPGDATGSNPYVVTFDKGALAGTNATQLTLDSAKLGVPIGTQLKCKPKAVSAEEAGSFAFQWLANGQEIPSATTPTYTLSAGDSGKTVQCRVAATFNFSTKATILNVNRAYALAGSVPSPNPPTGPTTIQTPEESAPLTVGGAGGQTLTCKAGLWGDTPTTYTYQWYITGQPLGPPTTTASTSNTYVTTAGDVAQPSAFQCSVTATNASGSSTMFSDFRMTDPPITGAGVSFVEFPKVSVVDPTGASPAVTMTNGGAVLEVCNANPPSNDVCKSGVSGDGVGQLASPRGIAVDNSPGASGDVYVGDDRNFRIQKFTATGTPISVLGGNVDKTTGGNVCTVASGDACGIGVQSLDATPGAFGGWPSANFSEEYPTEEDFTELGNTVAVDSTGNLYVTDPYKPAIPGVRARIQKFNSSGAFQGQVRTGFQKPIAVAVDAAGNVYTSLSGAEQAGVMVFEPSEFTPEGSEQAFSERHLIHGDAFARAIAIDPVDDKIWLSDQNTQGGWPNGESGQVCGEESPPRRAILGYDAEGHRLDCTVPLGLGTLESVSGMAVSPSGLAYVAVRTQNRIKVFELPQEGPPVVNGQSVSDITTETAKIHGNLSAGFEPTTYKLEYGPDDCAVSACSVVPGPDRVYGIKGVPVELRVAELEPGTAYHFRWVAENGIDTATGPDRTFTTFPFVDLRNDSCSNALARKQTRTAGLLDCRAYELASADFTGGYDVVSDLAPGQSPFDGYPDAVDKVLYAVRDGGIPNTGSPTNRGPDPYIATRGAEGWSTEYVGIPADGGFSKAPFSSTLAGADAGLETFAFAGPQICSPCFADGSSGTPLRLPDGDLLQGMSGSIPQPTAVPAGYVGRSLSADGSHYVFGSTAKFEPAGDTGGSIYDRDLSTDTTQVVSTLPDGTTIAGGDVGELGISNDGSRIVVGKKISTDTEGNSYWHLYLHQGTSPNSHDLTVGTTSGVLFDGMTSDGSSVFFTTDDELLPADTDESADIYSAQVDGGGSVTLQIVSTAGPTVSNDDSCTPPGFPNGWNAVSGAGKCNAVALAGGAGVAADDGSFYFLSPELLDGGEGIPDQPNLYVWSGSGPEFVATLDDSARKPPPPAPNHPVANATFISGLSSPEALAVDESNGDLYVVERGNGSVNRYTSAGSPHNFTAGPNSGANKITGLPFEGPFEEQVAVDNATGSPFYGAFYVATGGSQVRLYASSGEQLGAITSSGYVCGVAVDPSNGDVYVSDYYTPGIQRFRPVSGTAPVTSANYTQTSIKTEEEFHPCQIGADGGGHVFASAYPNGPLKSFNASAFAAGPLLEGSSIAASPSNTIYADPVSGDLYVDAGNRVILLDSNLKKVKEFASGSISFSRGVAVNGANKHVYAVGGSNIVEFGVEPERYEPIDQTAVVHGVKDNEIHRYGDFQVTPDGAYALLSTRLPQSESYDNADFNMVYRYAAASGGLDCISCLLTGGVPTANASLPQHGLGIVGDGRTFFNSRDQLVMRDTNGRQDAYEWKGGDTSLISTGFSAFDSGLLTVSSDAKDAFFFTRESLVPRDRNGQAMKLYDARADGGVFILPSSPPCAASDECHGAGTEAAPPPPIGSFRGVGGQHSDDRCKKGFVKKHGRCVRKRPKHKGRHRTRAAKHGQGGRG
jgi:NHL repeat